MATFSDNFNRADGALGANWTQLTGASALAIFSSQVRTNTVSPRSIMVVATGAAAFSADYRVEVDLATLAGGDFIGVAWRGTPGAGTCYFVRIDGAENFSRRVHRFDNDTITNIGNADLPATSGARLAVECEGSEHRVYLDGVLIDTVTDATYASGQPGLAYDYQNNRASRLDNFYAEDLVAAPTPTGVTPAFGRTAGGTAVTIAGAGFVDGCTVTFDGVAATSVVFVDTDELTCVTPAGTAGAVDVVVTNPDTLAGTLSNGFTYTTGPTATSPLTTDGTGAAAGTVASDEPCDGTTGQFLRLDCVSDAGTLRVACLPETP